MRILFLSLLLLSLSRASFGAKCEFFPPPDSATGEDFGFIFIPGAQLPGERYIPLVETAQAMLSGGRMWGGVTEGWLGDFPNPIEISGAVQACVDAAYGAGIRNSKIYIGGHSLGGIVLEEWIKLSPDSADGILLLGSYLPDLFGTNENTFPVPVLTAIGELDGGAVSYLYREWLESKAIDDLHPEAVGQFPCYVIEAVNHGQVASGEMPDVVVDRDLPAEVSAEEAWRRYAEAIVSFVTIQNEATFPAEDVENAQSIAGKLETFTETYLQPINDVAQLESSGTECPWTVEGQKVLLVAEGEDTTQLTVESVLVPEGEDIGHPKPALSSPSDCAAVVTTYGQPQYSFDPLDFGSLTSATVIKAKFKLEDPVVRTLCLAERTRGQCKDINQRSLDVALSLASEKALQRYNDFGRKLVFLDDSVSPWGPGWELSFGLHYKKMNETHTSIYSTSLVSEEDFFVASAAGMHYCDLLSPYRALEWIYITSVQQGYMP